MKKLVLISMIFISCFIYAISLCHPSGNKKTLEKNIDFRLIVRFDQNVDNGKCLYIKPGSLKSRNIRKLLKKYEVKDIKAVFSNRYNQSGKLKPDQKFSNSLSTFRQLMLNDSVKAKELSILLKNEKGVLLATIEKPIIIKPCITPNDVEYSDQWYLNSTINPLADIDAESAWDINT